VRRERKRVEIGRADLLPGERRLVEVDGRQIGIFNVAGEYFALHNRCPHMGGNLCEGPVTGTTMLGETGRFVYGMDGEVLRCAWHGWEFEIRTGKCLADGRIQARRYPVTIEDGLLVLHI
jgi:3-phenylpropionate/trans-cinnamate dioxygenase ferredoxin subunit